MPEAYGLVVILASEEALRGFLEGGQAVSWEAIETLFEYCVPGVSLSSIDPIMEMYVDEAFVVEELVRIESGAIVYVGYDLWMTICDVLVEKGENIEVYGRIEGEYGNTRCYALLSQDQRYIHSYELQGDENVAEAAFHAWLAQLPEKITSLNIDGLVDDHV